MDPYHLCGVENEAFPADRIIRAGSDNLPTFTTSRSNAMACRAFSGHRAHVPLRLGDPGPIEHEARCCCVKPEVACDPTPAERRPLTGPQYCRCGAVRPPSLDHLFIPEDLSLVPSHLKFSKDRFRGVRVDGRMYFLPNRSAIPSVLPGNLPASVKAAFCLVQLSLIVSSTHLPTGTRQSGKSRPL